MLTTGWYTPIEAPGHVRHLLLAAWTAIPTGRHTLVPDGCAELLWLSQGRLAFCAPETSAWSFELQPGTTAVGIRFRPGIPHALWRVDLSSLREQRVPAEQVLGTTRSDEWLSRIAAAPDLVSARDALVEAFANEYNEATNSRDADLVLRALLDHPAADASALAGLLHTTLRTLHRRCLRLFGYGTATLVRLLRFQRFLSAAIARPAVLSDLAADAGYADQAP